MKIALLAGLFYVLPNIVGLLFAAIFARWVRFVDIYKGRFIFFMEKLFPGKYDWVAGITFGQFIFVKIADNLHISDVMSSDSKQILIPAYRILIHHELCHSIQQLMLGGLFFVIYLINYLINLLKYKDSKMAYYNIYFEEEARLYSTKDEK